MTTITEVSVDVRNLCTVRVTKFDLTSQYDPALPKYMDVLFEVQSDKTRAVLDVSIRYGVMAGADTPATLLGETMSVYTDATFSELRPFDAIKQDAWTAVMYTTDTNRAGANAGTGSGFADIAWDTIVAWVVRETSKPGLTHTVNVL